MMLLEKAVYNKFVTEINAIDASVFVLKNQYYTDKSGLEKKINDADKRIPDTNGHF